MGVKMKDKIKPLKEINDDTSIITPNPVQPTVFRWNSCVICGMDLHKNNPKKRIINGVQYVSLASKKHYTLWGKKICWNCVFGLVKQFKSSH